VEPRFVSAPFDSRRANLVGPAIAERIIAEVIELGWPVGRLLGSESELIDQYGISRAVLREAVRLLEHQRVAVMRRGPGGGLIVDEPDIGTVINAVIVYLLRVDATLDEVIDARLVLEELVAELAARRITEADIEPLRATLTQESAGQVSVERLLHSALAELTANPVLELFVDILTRVGDYFTVGDAALTPDLQKEASRAHRRISEAVLAKDPGLARSRMRKHLLAEADIVRRHASTVQRLPATAALDGAVGNKRAEALARRIFTDILQAGLSAGAFVGSEASLMAKHTASRAVLREALRILGYHQIAEMRRGPGGGLFVAPAESAAITDIIAIYLRRHGVGPAHVVELLTGLELAVVERVSDRLGGDQAKPVAEALSSYLREDEKRGPHPALDWHSLLASLTGNRTLTRLHQVVMRLGWLFFSRTAETDPAVAQLSEPSTVEPVHTAITEALLAGDKELAMMRMRAHLTPLGSTAT
jgi:DNA-binding FadR family transcriptional regulator